MVHSLMSLSDHLTPCYFEEKSIIQKHLCVAVFETADVKARHRLTERSTKIQSMKEELSCLVYMVGWRNWRVNWKITMGYIWVVKGCWQSLLLLHFRGSLLPWESLIPWLRWHHILLDLLSLACLLHSGWGSLPTPALYVLVLPGVGLWSSFAVISEIPKTQI